MGSEQDEEIERRIATLMARSAKKVPSTRRLLASLSKIEEALASGVSRKELAELYELTVDQFAAALAGARKLERQGGDGRRTEVKQKRKATIGSRGPKERQLDASLVKKL